jgi:hypothetical protein
MPMAPDGSSLAGFLPLKAAEEKLKKACRTGDWASISDRRPAKPAKGKVVRASFVRFLAIGGDVDAPVHAKGIQLFGAAIAGDLDLEACDVKVPLWFGHCLFDGQFIARDARLRGLYFIGSRLGGIQADRLRCEGSLFLRAGDLKVDGKTIAERFESTGPITLQRAEIAGNVEFRGADLESTKAALQARGIRVDGDFIWREVKCSGGTVNLTAGRFEALFDDWPSWEGAGEIFLNGLCFTSASYKGGLRWRERASWLKKQGYFSPHPWQQTALVLRGAGLVWQAEQLAIELENELRRKIYSRKRGVQGTLLRGGHWFWGLIAGYGYRPMRVLWALLVLLLVSLSVFHVGAQLGVFAPADPGIYVAQRFAGCGPGTGGANWVDCSALPSEYPAFNSFIYALDVILPVVDLSMERAWAPMAVTGFGQAVRALVWLDILLGWLGSLALVAALTRLLQRS